MFARHAGKVYFAFRIINQPMKIAAVDVGLGVVKHS